MTSMLSSRASSLKCSRHRPTDKDQREKLLLCRNIDSLRGYLIVSHDERWIELHERQDDCAWLYQRAISAERVELPCLDVTLTPDGLFDSLPGAD